MKSDSPANSKSAPSDAAVQVSKDAGWKEDILPVPRIFPGPRVDRDILRVAVERKAYADIVSHAKQSLDAEICGVLAGEICEDDEGAFVHIQAAVRGDAARESNARVTFTQETWNSVHKTMERDYPKLRMVGWYHSHPGFGVEFSEMDIFIQKNFFPSPLQVALVMDPLGGDMAICHNAEKGVDYLDRFWVDGREHALRVPASVAEKTIAKDARGDGSKTENIQNLEARLGQLIQAVDEQRAFFYRFLTTLLIFGCLGIACAVGYFIYSSYTAPLEPPRLNGYVPVPVQVGDKTVLIGVGVVSWDVPPKLNAICLELEKQKQAALEKAAGNDASKKQPVPLEGEVKPDHQPSVIVLPSQPSTRAEEGNPADKPKTP